MFILMFGLILITAILVIIFTERIISILLSQQRHLIRFFSSDNLPKIYDKLLDDQASNDNRFRYRKIWIRTLAVIVILFDLLAFIFYWISMNLG